MIQTEEIIIQIIREIEAYTTKTVIRADQGGDKPPYPYIVVGWHITGTRGQPRIVTWEAVPSTDPSFEKDILYTYLGNPVIVLNVTVVDRKEGFEIDSLTQKIKDWFDIPQLANRALEKLGANIDSTYNIEVRDTQMDWEYERRQGFDADIRVPDIATFRENTIETIRFKNGKELKVNGGV